MPNRATQIFSNSFLECSPLAVCNNLFTKNRLQTTTMSNLPRCGKSESLLICFHRVVVGEAEAEGEGEGEAALRPEGLGLRHRLVGVVGKPSLPSPQAQSLLWVLYSPH